MPISASFASRADALSAVCAAASFLKREQGLDADQIQRLITEALQINVFKGQQLTVANQRSTKALEEKYRLLISDIHRIMTQGKLSDDAIRTILLDRLIKDMGFDAGYLWDIEAAGPAQKNKLSPQMIERFVKTPQLLMQMTCEKFLVPDQEHYEKVSEYSPQQRELFKKLQQRLATSENDVAKLRELLNQYLASPYPKIFTFVLEKKWPFSLKKIQGLLTLVLKIKRLTTMKLANKVGLIAQEGHVRRVEKDEALALINDPEILFQLLIEERQKNPKRPTKALLDLFVLWQHSPQNKQISAEEQAILNNLNLDYLIKKTFPPVSERLATSYIELLVGRRMRRLQDREIALFNSYVAQDSDILTKILANAAAKIRELHVQDSVLARVCLLGRPILVHDSSDTTFRQDALLVSIGGMANGSTGYTIVPFDPDLRQMPFLEDNNVDEVEARRTQLFAEANGKGLYTKKLQHVMHFIFREKSDPNIKLKLLYAKEICGLIASLEKISGNMDARDDLIRRLAGEGDQLIANITQQREAFEAPHRVSKHIYFSDVAGFTAFIERMQGAGQLEKATAILNDYFEHKHSIITRHKGIIDKFIGDAVMAHFPHEPGDPELAFQAASAILAMEAEIASLNSFINNKYNLSGELELKIIVRMGMHAGEPIAVALGAKNRLTGTLIGDDVNLAARLEPLCARYKVSNLVSSTVVDSLGDRLAYVPVDDIVVKGKTHPVAIHTLLAHPEQLSENQKTGINRYRKAFMLMRQQQYESAASEFQAVLLVCQKEPAFGLTKLVEYQLQHCQRFQQANRIIRELVSLWHNRQYDLIEPRLLERAGSDLVLMQILNDSEAIKALIQDCHAEQHRRRSISLDKFEYPRPGMQALQEAIALINTWSGEGINQAAIDILNNAKPYFQDDTSFSWIIEELLLAAQSRQPGESLSLMQMAVMAYINGEYYKANMYLFELKNAGRPARELGAKIERLDELIQNSKIQSKKQLYYRALGRLLKQAGNPYLQRVRQLQQLKPFQQLNQQDSQAIISLLERIAPVALQEARLDHQAILEEWDNISRTLSTTASFKKQIGALIKRGLRQQLLWGLAHKLTGKLLSSDKFPGDTVGLNILGKIAKQDEDIVSSLDDDEIFLIINNYVNWANNLAANQPEQASQYLTNFLAVEDQYRGRRPFLDFLFGLAKQGQALGVGQQGPSVASSKSG